MTTIFSKKIIAGGIHYPASRMVEGGRNGRGTIAGVACNARTCYRAYYTSLCMNIAICKKAKANEQ